MSEPSETTLSDYLRTVSQQWPLIVLVTLACAGTTLALSLSQTKTYEATATLAVREPGQDLNLIGGGVSSGQTPLQIASAHAPQVTRPTVVRRAKAKLDSKQSIDSLRGAVNVQIDPNSYVVEITARSSDPEEAAQIANAFASADAKLTTAETRKTYEAAAEKLEARIKELDVDKDSPESAIYLGRLSNLQALASVAQPVQVSDQAEVPETPVAPKPVRNTVAAAVFGFLLGIALAYMRRSLDRRLRDPGDVEQVFVEPPVIGRVRPQAFGHTGSAKDQESKKLGPLDAVDGEGFRMLRENVRYLAIDQGLRTIAITSAVAEEGKSTVAACLAMANAAAGKRTLLVDCDLRRGVLATRFGLAEGPGLADYLLGKAEPQDILQVVSVPAPGSANGSAPSSLVCIAAGSQPPRPADILSSERFHSFLGMVADAYDCVIVDCPPLLPVADTREIVPYVSGVLMCVRLKRTTRDQAEAARDALERLPECPVGIVLTGVKESKDYYGGYYQYQTHRQVSAAESTPDRVPVVAARAQTSTPEAPAVTADDA